MDSTVSSEGGEEEKNNESGVTEVWTNPNSASQEQDSPYVNTEVTASDSIPRRNPPRNRKPTDRLTY